MLPRLISGWRFSRALRQAQTVMAASGASARDIVILPCWRRPEMLWHCLDNLCRTDGFVDQHLVLRPDSGFDPDVLAVIAEFSKRLPSFEIQTSVVCPYRRTKLSANILVGYLRAMHAAQRYVYLLEEDIMVARDFFRWHEAVHAQGTALFCSIAVQNHNRHVQIPTDTGCYYLSSGDYCSWGVCFDANVLREHVAPHINSAYLSRPKRYIRRHFAASHIGLGFVEQAGLIRRIQERCALPLAYPAVPRAFHAGYYGNNRPGGVEGPLSERVHRLDALIHDAEAMRRVALNAQYAADSIPINLRGDVWHTQRCVSV